MPFTVARHAWHCFHAPAPTERWLARLPGSRPLATFADARDAEAFARARELAARERLNPFRCGYALADVSSLPAFAFKDFLLDDGVRMAKPDSRAELHWDRWWDRESPRWPPEVRARVWDALDLVRFHSVVARPASGWAFVPVAALAWGGSVRSRGYRHAPEGGRVLGAYPARADALAALELFAQAPESPHSPRELRHATGPARDPLAEARRNQPPPREPFDQVIAVPLTGEVARGQPVWCVARRALTVAMRADRGVVGPQFLFDAVSETRWGWSDTGSPHHRAVTTVNEFHLVPHAVYADPEAAAAAAAELERETRRRVNPLRLAAWDSDRLFTEEVVEQDERGVYIWTEYPFDWRDRFAPFGVPPEALSLTQPGWWDDYARPESDDVFHRLYDVFDRVRFAEVVELAWD